MSSPPHDLRAKTLHGGFWAAAGAAGTAAGAMASFIVLSRVVGPEAYGLIGMVDAAIYFGQRLMSSGLSEPLIQMPRLRDDHSDTLFWTLQAVALLLTAGTLALRDPLAGWFHEPRLPILLVASAASLNLQALGLVSSSLLARRFEFRATAQANVVSELVAGAIAIGMAWRDYGVWALVVHRLVLAGANSAMLMIRAGWWPRLHFSTRALSEVWRFSASRGLEGMLAIVDQQVPRFMLGRVSGAVELGYFIFARRAVENTVRLMSSPLRVAALSSFSAMQDDMPRVRRAYHEGTGLSTAIILPSVAGIMLTAPYLVPLLVGGDWGPAVLLLQLLVLASIRTSFHLWNAALLRGLGQPQQLLVASFVRTAAVLILIFFLLPWGAPGVCIATVVGSACSWPVAMFYIRRAAGMTMDDQLGPAKAPFFATLAMSAAVLGLQWVLDARLNDIAMLALSIATGALVYALGLFLLGRPLLGSLWRNLQTLRGSSKTI